MSEWRFRAAESTDAEAFSKWVAENDQIEPRDLLTALSHNNPTTIFFVVERDGKPILFAPFYCQMMLAYLGFNPDSDGKDRLKALQTMLDGAMGFAVQFGIHEIATLSKENYPVARWAVGHGFELESRQFFKFDINRVLSEAEAEPCAPVAE